MTAASPPPRAPQPSLWRAGAGFLASTILMIALLLVLTGLGAKAVRTDPDKLALRGPV